MAQLSNKYFLVLLSALLCSFVFSQEKNDHLNDTKKFNERDYQKGNEFKKYHKVAHKVASWQIQNLKFGAIIVRLQNNQRKIDALKKIGDYKKAKLVQAETQYYNKIMIKAYTNELNFCKVYFIYPQYSDSLLKGKRKGIFIDSTLKVNPLIEMQEQFYIIAEKDFVYNSSIGFVKEDTARYMLETGTKSIDAPAVLKNKYGHQLKDPFPYFVQRSALINAVTYTAEETIINEDNSEEKIKLTLFKDISLQKQSEFINLLNNRLKSFYLKSQGEEISDPAVKPFLY